MVTDVYSGYRVPQPLQKWERKSGSEKNNWFLVVDGPFDSTSEGSWAYKGQSKVREPFWLFFLDQRYEECAQMLRKRQDKPKTTWQVGDKVTGKYQAKWYGATIQGEVVLDKEGEVVTNEVTGASDILMLDWDDGTNSKVQLNHIDRKRDESSKVSYRVVFAGGIVARLTAEYQDRIIQIDEPTCKHGEVFSGYIVRQNPSKQGSKGDETKNWFKILEGP